MKRYLILSFLVHVLLAALTMLKLGQISEEKQQKKKQEQKALPVEIEVIEQVASVPEMPKKDERKFYWGIGISVDYQDYTLPGYMGTVRATKVEKVYQGYNAESAGLLEGDLIYLINGSPITFKNDIVGDGPGTLILTILRNGSSIVRVQLERCKVYY